MELFPAWLLSLAGSQACLLQYLRPACWRLRPVQLQT